MKKIFKRLVILSIIVTMIGSLSGCGVSIMGKEYTFFETPKRTESSIFDGVGSENSGEQQISAENNISSISSEIPAGNITISKSETGKIEIRADIKVKGKNEDIKNEILNNSMVKLETNGDRAKLELQTKDGNDFWKWHKSNYSGYLITINYDIEIPERMEFDLSTGAGNLSISDIEVALTASTGAGNISMSNTKLTDEIEISTGAGNVNIDGEFKDLDNIRIDNGAGNISLSLPAATSMELSVDTGVGNVGGSIIKDSGMKNHSKQDVNGGGPRVELNSGVGNISVDGY